MQSVNWQVSVHVCSQLACWSRFAIIDCKIAIEVFHSQIWVILLPVIKVCNCVYFRSPDQCRVLGYRKSCCPYPSCERWWNSPLWPGCFWKCILLTWIEVLVFPLYLYYCLCQGQLKLNQKTCTDGVICVWLCDQWQNAYCHMLAHMADEQQSLSKYEVLQYFCSWGLFKPPWLWSRCVVEVACLPPLKLGAAGTEGSTQPRSAMPSALLWLPLPFLPLWWPKVSSRNNTCWVLRSFRNTFTLKCLYG